MTNRHLSITTGIICALLVASTAMAAGTLNNEPMVFYDTSGHGIAGPIHEHLAVYSSGLTSHSSLDATVVGTTSGFDPGAAFTTVPIARVGQLLAALLDAGAMSLGDLPDAGSDLPLRTVTVFAGPSDEARRNTFSFYDPNDPRVESILAALDGFMFEAFGTSDVAGLRSDPEVAVGTLLTLRYGESEFSPALDLGLRFADVPADSRCPVDVWCPWVGEIEIVLHTWFHGVHMGEVHLTYGGGVGSSTIIAGGYEVQLLGVRPEARSNDPILLEEYGILLKISEP